MREGGGKERIEQGREGGREGWRKGAREGGSEGQIELMYTNLRQSGLVETS